VDDVTLLTAADAVRPEDAGDLVRAEYGLAGDLARLPGEADDNFLLETPAGERYVVKVAHPMTDPDIIDRQAHALRHLKKTTNLPVQRVIPSLGGRLWVQPRDRIVLVTRYLTGTPMRQVPMTAPLRRHLGITLAALARALKDLPGKPRPLLWDISQLPALRPLAAELPPRLGRDLLTGLIDRFQDGTEPGLKTLRTQLVHNDFNVDNILIDDGHDRVQGILDFGDMTVTALANDVAIAACYQLAGEDEADLVRPALDLIAGYHATTPLAAAEQDLLPGLILARLTARVVVSRWRVIRFPGNEEYIMRGTAMAWTQLNRLLAVPAEEFAERLHAACQKEQPDA
jgi:Ser/Thr protein kinase RdoA (MazF antagonist)